jgi:RND family efflux transporter MFP subunit
MNRKLKLAALVGVSAAALVVVGGTVSRVMAHQDISTWSQDQAIPTVTLASLKPGGEGDGSLQLPGDVQAFNSAPIHPRVNGYLKRWYVDIGAPVTAGQLLAEIDSPDLDAQVAQARADLAVAEANQRLAATTAERWKGLLASDAVSRQDAEDKNGDLAAKISLVNSGKANLNRLLALESFKRITAPFAGVVTARNADIGQLVAEGTPTSQPLFTVADEHKLRIYVQVPQSYTAQIQPGMVATLAVPEYPGRSFTAKLVNTSRAINAANGALTAELWIDNAEHALKPGEYAQVRFDLPAAAGSLRVPASALIAKHDGLSVAVVGPGSRVQIRRLQVVRDLGASVEVSGGITAADNVIDNPADTLQGGDLVRISGASAEAHRRGAAHG